MSGFLFWRKELIVMKDFIFVMFVGTAAIILTMMIQQQPVPIWFSVIGITLMLFNFYLKAGFKNDKKENSTV